MNTAFYVDSFTSLDELKAADQRDEIKVLRAIIAANGRFSIFDATANQRIASTLERLSKSGWMIRAKDQPSYPWIQVELTDAGRAALGEK